jgi:hypothetical protein
MMLSHARKNRGKVMAYVPGSKSPAIASTGLETTTQTTGVGFNSAASAFGQTVLPLTHYAEAPGSSTITTLPENSTISTLTPELNALGPPIPERPKVEFGELTCSSWDFPKIVYSATLAGVRNNSPLADAICRRLSCELGGASPVASKDCAKGIEISFEDLAASRATATYRRLGNFITNLQALGASTNDLKLIDLNSVWQDLAARTPWHFYESRESRKECIKTLMSYGLFQPALLLLADFMKVDASVIKDFALPFVQNELKLSTVVEIKGNDLRALKSLVCCDLSMRLNHFTRAGAMVLQDIATIDNNSSELEPYQIFVFETIASKVIFDEHALEKLLDLPGIVPGDLFQNPKARFLLLDVAGLGAVEYRDAYGEMTNLHDAFEKIDKHYHAIYFKSRKRLQEKFVIHDFPDRAEILARSPFTPVSEKSVEQLLQLAEAACMIGFEEEAVAVLEFLVPKEELSERHRAGLKPLADRILMSARFNPERQFRTSHYNAVKSRIDSIVFPESGQGKGQQKPEPGV